MFIELHPMPPVGDGLFPVMLRRSVSLRQKAAVDQTEFNQRTKSFSSWVSLKSYSSVSSRCYADDIGRSRHQDRASAATWGSRRLSTSALPPAVRPDPRRCGSGITFRREGNPMSEDKTEAHWQQTRNLMFKHLGVWLFFGYIIHFFVVPLNAIKIPILGFPLGFYMAAQGSLIVFVVMLFMFARQQDKIDRDHGFAEDD
jgi:putative solute:sodium symporter small subunit